MFKTEQGGFEFVYLQRESEVKGFETLYPQRESEVRGFETLYLQRETEVASIVVDIWQFYFLLNNNYFLK